MKIRMNTKTFEMFKEVKKLSDELFEELTCDNLDEDLDLLHYFEMIRSQAYSLNILINISQSFVSFDVYDQPERLSEKPSKEDATV